MRSGDEDAAANRMDVVEVVALVLRISLAALREHEVIVRIDVEDGGTALLADGVAAARVLSDALKDVCASSRPFAQLSIHSRVHDDNVELVLTSSCGARDDSESAPDDRAKPRQADRIAMRFACAPCAKRT